MIVSHEQALSTYPSLWRYGRWRRIVTPRHTAQSWPSTSSVLRGARGRVPGGSQWQFAAEAPRRAQVLVCNGGETSRASGRSAADGTYPHKIVRGRPPLQLSIGRAEAVPLVLSREYDARSRVSRGPGAEAREAGFVGERLFWTGRKGVDIQLHHCATTSTWPAQDYGATKAWKAKWRSARKAAFRQRLPVHVRRS